jgi:glycosyltransferase involved in cell wall biosynthesis
MPKREDRADSRSMVRVLQFLAAGGASGTRTGAVNGPERRSANAVSEWRRAGVEMRMVYPSRGRFFELFRREGVLYADYEMRGKLDFSSPFLMARMLRDSGAHVAYSQGPGSLDAAVAIAAAIAHVPHVITRPVLISDLRLSRVRRELYRMIDVLALLLAKRVVFVSELLRARQVAEFSWLGPKAVTILNGVELGKYREARKSAHVDPRRIVCAAQLRPEKMIGDIVDVVDGVRRAGVDVCATIFGDGPLREPLQNKIDALGLRDCVVLAGHTEELPDVLPSAGVFLFPSSREGLSVAVIEALAAGLPVVATDTGGIREQVVDGWNGYVVPVSDVGGMQEAIIRIVTDRELRDALGARSAELAEEKFEQNVMISRYRDLFAGVRRPDRP